VKFLVDAQLPPALARWIEEKGHVAEHVRDVGLASATDDAIWRFAYPAPLALGPPRG
jgi:predicted nuclease of predicted toxin-antitoxin system